MLLEPQGSSAWTRSSCGQGTARKPPGSFLLIISPPGLEPFFEEFSRLIVEAPQDLERQAELASQFGLEFV
jgi:hypothetical protein